MIKTYVIADVSIEHTENTEQYNVLLINRLIVLFVLITVQNNDNDMLHNIHQIIRKIADSHILKVLFVIFSANV